VQPLAEGSLQSLIDDLSASLAKVLGNCQNEAGATKRLQGPPLHTLYQLSAAMRALADVSQQQQRLQLQLQLACPHLIRAAEVSMGELEVQANVVRTLRWVSISSF